MKTNYPWQVASVIHKTKSETKTLGIDAMLFSPQEEDEVRTPTAPLEMHEGYSRFKGTLILKKNAETNLLTFNIPAKSVPYIYKRTNMAMDAGMNRQNAPKKDDSDKSDLAYTVTIKSGTLSGKTPAQVASSPDGISKLEKQKEFLKKNVAKYPANQSQIDAIDNAISLFKSGKLSATAETPDSSSFKIYESACKNIKPTDEKGRYTVYQVSITYDFGMNLPVQISIMNCFAPVDKTKGNEIIMSEAVNKQTGSIRLSEEEWFTMIDEMKASKDMFENFTYPTQLKLASKISKEIYDSSSK